MPLIHHFANGLTLIAEEIPFLRSAAVCIAVPAGCRHEPTNKLGLASVVCEMVQRGAGKRDSRELLSALDLLGVDRSASVTSSHTIFNAAMPRETLHSALEIYADTMRSPHLPDDQLDDALRGALLELQASEDDLAGRVMRQLRLRFYGEMLGRDPLGTAGDIESIEPDDVGEFYRRCYQADGTMIAVAGRFDWVALRSNIERLFGTWQTGKLLPEPLSTPQGGYEHLEHQSQQTHIALAFPAAEYRNKSQMLVQGAVGILGSGMSSRLFTRVREELGLCYTISASYGSSLSQGAVLLYAGTTSPRAQETLDVAWREVCGLRQGIEESEVDRLKVRLASLLVLEQESSSSRASAMISDWYHLGRVLSAAEIQDEIDSLSAESILEYWRGNEPQSPDLVTLGPEELRMPW